MNRNDGYQNLIKFIEWKLDKLTWTLSERGFVAVRQLPGIKILPEFKSTLRALPLSSVNEDDDTDATAPDGITWWVPVRWGVLTIDEPEVKWVRRPTEEFNNVCRGWNW